MRPIDADAVFAKLGRMVNYCETNGKGRELAILFRVVDAVMDCPTIGVVSVVRCKDCERMEEKGWCSLHNAPMDKNDFCSYGERRNNHETD